MTIDIHRFLSRERQFCNLCHGWVRVINVADMVLLRRGRTEAAALKAYRARRLRALLRHYRQFHADVEL
jgi:hypothetical protein